MKKFSAVFEIPSKIFGLESENRGIFLEFIKLSYFNVLFYIDQIVFSLALDTKFYSFMA